MDADLPFRAAPHNLQAEQALLGAILVNNEAHDRVSSFLEAHHFYDQLHGQIFETASKLIASGKQATPITLRTFFETAEPIDATLTVPQYLGRLAANAATIINARDYGRTIQDLAVRRGLILIGEDLVNTAYDSPVDFPPREQIEEAETRLFALAENGPNEQAEHSIADAAQQALGDIDSAYRRGGRLAGISTGIDELDEKTGGLVRGEVTILAGRTSMGKTALATNIAFNLAQARANSRIARPELKSDDPALDGAVVGYFSLEMTSNQLAMRRLAEESGIPAFDLRRGKITETEMRKLVVAAERFQKLPLRIDQSGGLTAAQLATRARRWRRKHGIGVIVVDYLQLVGGSVYRGKNRTQEITEVTTGLKSLAKELDVAILALAQVSRAVEDRNRDNKRPLLSDLRESGSIEQDADAVWFVFREDYYLERAKPDGSNQKEFDDWRRRLAEARGKAEIIISKQRHGPLDTALLRFDATTTSFVSPAEAHHA